jgi:hypothetical protein
MLMVKIIYLPSEEHELAEYKIMITPRKGIKSGCKKMEINQAKYLKNNLDKKAWFIQRFIIQNFTTLSLILQRGY